MRKIKWAVWGVIALIAGLFLEYTLPQHDVVYITDAINQIPSYGTINRYFYASPDSGTTGSATRSVRFINAVYPDGSVIVYRNEDTGFWPPYLKFDSSDLQAEASKYKSTTEAPKWVMITHYGWRIEFESIYPNAVRIREVAGPDATVFPWVNLIILTALAFGLFMLRRMWLQFWERMVDPAVAGVEEAQDRAKGFFGRIGAWFATWRRKS